jgi:hypothetical protein
VTYLRSDLPTPSKHSKPFLFGAIRTVRFVALTAILLSACVAQEQPQEQPQEQSPAEQKPAPESNQTQAKIEPVTVTIPAGTRLALVLTQPIQSRYIRRGEDIYAQVVAPVNSGGQVVIPPGTFVEGTVDKLARNGGRGRVRLQSMSITFPDGYVAPIEGPITLESNEGYAIKDPGGRRTIAAFALPAAGAGIGALIGHSVGTSDSTVNSTLPPGCVGGPPFCTPISTPTFGTKGKDAIIGAGIGGAIGGIASIALLFGSRNFFLDVGSPVEMTLQQPVTLKQDEVAEAVRQSAQHPVPPQPVAGLPQPPPPSPPISNHGTCYTPGTPGTPPTVVPGAPGPNGVPGPPTVIPGTPPTPGTPYPCP